jgi:hypothetical protein
MANEKQTGNDQPEVMTSRSSIVKAQAEYKGNQHSDLVEIKITADGEFYKKGDVDQVHPTMALILKEKGLIADTGKPVERPKFNQTDITVDA